MFGPLNALQQIVVELSRFQSLHVDEHAESSQLQMHFEEAGELRAVGPPVAHENVERFVERVLVGTRQSVL